MTDTELDQLARQHAVPGHATMINHRSFARAVLAAAIPSIEGSTCVPAGYALVPIEPTPAMVQAAVNQADKQETAWKYDGAAFWRDMLAAATSGDTKP